MTKTRFICINAIGIALFVALSLCLQVPVFENYYLCLGYIVIAVYCYHFGPASGAIVGCFGVLFYCLLISGLRGMPGWIAGNLIIGLGLGQMCKLTKRHPKTIDAITYAAAVLILTALGILLVKSGVEAVLYAQPLFVRFLKNSYAFVADIIILWLGYPVSLAVTPAIRKYVKSNKKETSAS